MVDKPDQYPAWAVNDISDPITGQPNVVTPPTENQNTGWLAKDFVPNSWWNWLARYTNLWIQYLAQQEEQATVNDGTGIDISYNVSNIPNGALCYIYVVDKGDASNVYHGMCYLAPNPSTPTSFVDIKQVGITTPSISATGTVTISGGTGPYICYCQTKIVP